MALVDPHGGGELLPLLLEGDALALERKHAATLPALRVSSREKGDMRVFFLRAIIVTTWERAAPCDG